MSRVEEVAAATVRERMRHAPDVVLLDCREPKELAIARIDGATHIPMGDIPSRQNELDPDAEIIVFCHHGVRGAKVARFLIEQGFANVRNLRGGIDAWSVEVDASVPRY